MEDTVYKVTTVGFNSGDVLLVLTDGFTEAADPGGALFGEARIEQYLAAHDPRSPGLLEALVSEVRSFEAGQPAFDDMAAVLLSLT
jgi:sigma-B regulation protein RsbU (phosphoserine phosphatase)